MACAAAVPASPWSTTAGWRPLRAWSAARREAIAHRLDTAAQAWALAWGLSDAGPFTAAGIDGAVLDQAWLPLGSLEVVPCAWVLLSPPQARWSALFRAGGLAPGPIARDLGSRCDADGRARLAAALGLQPSDAVTAMPPAALAAPWSGALLFRRPGGQADEAVLLDARAVAAVVANRGPDPTPRPPRPPRVPATAALRSRRLVLRVQLDGCALDLGTLGSLQVGDVLRLDHPLHVPARLADAAGRTCFSAYLACRDGRKAAVLAAPHTTEETP